MKFEWKNQQDEPIKIRTFLGQHGVSRALIIVAKYHGGAILLDGRPAYTSALMTKGQVATLELPSEKSSEVVTRCDDPIDILYEDDDYLVLNKPAGVASVPAHHVERADSLVNRVKGYYERQQYENQVTHIATRLDKNTSGIVVFPKHHFAHSVLDKQLKEHRVQKDYIAVVEGRLDVKHGLIDAPIARDSESFVKRQVDPNGKPSQTEYWLEDNLSGASIVRIRLHTGRTHQIRVHFAYLHHPLVGDDMYGGPMWLNRQALHCSHIKFFSPFKQKFIQIDCTVPDDLAKIVN
ncbi:RluA family pseudouridine synthase [Paucilactobacillus suebicus]|uniref:Pseudouridine synthase n=1 Tax=Paucilactobacillus suebicus DSM 5007 = KCTC 3549 TaxID=1423807 RepID=A0A0R1W479_9LACO|nr:RluA family pseudouridine synthase [Paucilactobacillus suebicus]KRM12574.1 pseudouridine synthase [Paucilactobacillus suebicus DSM 5007 = KCTC 3549]